MLSTQEGELSDICAIVEALRNWKRCIGETEVGAFLVQEARRVRATRLVDAPRRAEHVGGAAIYGVDRLFPAVGRRGHVKGTGAGSRRLTENHRREAVPAQRKSQGTCFVGISAALASANVVGIEETSPGAVGNALAGFGHVSSHRPDSPRAPQHRSYKSRSPLHNSRTPLLDLNSKPLSGQASLSPRSSTPCSSGSLWSSR